MHFILLRHKRIMLVPLNSLEGKRRLEEAAGIGESCQDNANGSFLQHKIVNSFRKQRGNTVCGLALLAVLLTARKRSLAKATKTNERKENNSWKEIPNPNLVLEGNLLFVDKDHIYPMLGEDTCGIVLEEKIRKSGMAMDQIRTLAEALPTTESAISLFPKVFNDEKSNINCETKQGVNLPPHHNILQGPQDLRELLASAMSKPSHSEGIVLNYHMSTLGQVPFGGHLSPVAGYHAASDSLLVMDVWHTQTEPIWAPLQDVWTAVSGTDPKSQRPRGLLRVVHVPEAG